MGTRAGIKTVLDDFCSDLKRVIIQWPGPPTRSIQTHQTVDLYGCYRYLCLCVDALVPRSGQGLLCGCNRGRCGLNSR